MSLAIVYSRAAQGIDAPLVRVEVHFSRGMPRISVVGLPEAAVRESKDRVRSAIINSQFSFPIKRLTVNLAPADLRKEGGRFDLPIAIGILAASGQLPVNQLQHYEILGELALNGELRGFHGCLPCALACKQAGRRLIIPAANAEEAAVIKAAHILPASHLIEVCQHLQGQAAITPYTIKSTTNTAPPSIDMADIKGQYQAKRALEIAASGRHSILFYGPPGTGKSMLASRLSTITPTLTEQEALAKAAIASIAGKGFNAATWRQAPFRNPHHTASSVALVGGGSPPSPGEISLAHHGILFLDELPEFSRQVLESLREPMETGRVTISRAARQAEFPACFQLIAAMNPCPCGYQGDKDTECRCSQSQILRYRGKISGPLLDRFDMVVEVPRMATAAILADNQASETSQCILQRVIERHAIQRARSQCLNHDVSAKQLKQVATLNEEEQDFLSQAMDKLRLSARSLHRVLRLARTIADMDKQTLINRSHLAEALSYRRGSDWGS